MKCRDCEKWGWGDDEGTPVWGWCRKHTSCPDPDIDRSCSDFSPKKPDIFTILSTLQAENEKLRDELNDLRTQWDMYGGDEGITSTFAELEQVKRERDAAIDCIYKFPDPRGGRGRTTEGAEDGNV